jgi:hypothetical protein
MNRRRKTMVYKRWKGKKVKPGDPNYDEARWWMEYRLNGPSVHQAIPEARTKEQAERAEVSERERSTTGDTTEARR